MPSLISENFLKRHEFNDVVAISKLRKKSDIFETYKAYLLYEGIFTIYTHDNIPEVKITIELQRVLQHELILKSDKCFSYTNSAIKTYFQPNMNNEDLLLEILTILSSFGIEEYALEMWRFDLVLVILVCVPLNFEKMHYHKIKKILENLNVLMYQMEKVDNMRHDFWRIKNSYRHRDYNLSARYHAVSVRIFESILKGKPKETIEEMQTFAVLMLLTARECKRCDATRSLGVSVDEAVISERRYGEKFEANEDEYSSDITTTIFVVITALVDVAMILTTVIMLVMI